MDEEDAQGLETAVLVMEASMVSDCRQNSDWQICTTGFRTAPRLGAGLHLHLLLSSHVLQLVMVSLLTVLAF